MFVASFLKGLRAGNEICFKNFFRLLIPAIGGFSRVKRAIEKQVEQPASHPAHSSRFAVFFIPLRDRDQRDQLRGSGKQTTGCFGKGGGHLFVDFYPFDAR